jgi:hypothetical protein
VEAAEMAEADHGRTNPLKGHDARRLAAWFGMGQGESGIRPGDAG